MGCWGMGIAQNDEYGEVYERAMEAYDAGEDITAATQKILQEYLAEFDAEDGVLHDVYFALAKAQWMCGALTEDILHRVETIIESGANVEWMRSLDATESDLVQRQRYLLKFLSGLQTPREKPRKRKAPPKPTFSDGPGTLFWYRVKEHVYGGLYLGQSHDQDLVAFTEELAPLPEDAAELLEQPVYTAAWCWELLPQQRIHTVGHIVLEKNYSGSLGLFWGVRDGQWTLSVSNIGDLGTWRHEHRMYVPKGLKLKDMLNVDEMPENVPFHWETT